MRELEFNLWRWIRLVLDQDAPHTSTDPYTTQPMHSGMLASPPPWQWPELVFAEGLDKAVSQCKHGVQHGTQLNVSL